MLLALGRENIAAEEGIAEEHTAAGHTAEAHIAAVGNNYLGRKLQLELQQRYFFHYSVLGRTLQQE